MKIRILSLLLFLIPLPAVAQTYETIDACQALDREITAAQEEAAALSKLFDGTNDETAYLSDLNEGSVTNLDPALVLEYSHRVDKGGAHRIGGLQVPMGVYGMTASIAAHQTLLARAGAEEDPRLLYEALRAYPIGADTRSAHEMWRKLLISSKDFIAPAFQSMPDYYEI